MTEPITAKLATIYVRGEFFGNIHKIEAKDVIVTRGKYAQYGNAIFVQFTPKGKRKPRRIVDTYQPSVLILDGVGHPDPASMFGDATPSVDGEYSTKQSRHSSCSDEWQKDFDTLIKATIGANPAVVVADFRGVSAY